MFILVILIHLYQPKNLHFLLNEFFKIEGPKNNNAEGWKEFRQDKIKVENLEKKVKRKDYGSGRPRGIIIEI